MRYMDFSRYFCPCMEAQGLNASLLHAECCQVSYSWNPVRAMGDLPEVPGIYTPEYTVITIFRIYPGL